VFLPALPIPPTGIETVVATLARGLVPDRLFAQR
jgi:hypothetical protein